MAAATTTWRVEKRGEGVECGVRWHLGNRDERNCRWVDRSAMALVYLLKLDCKLLFHVDYVSIRGPFDDFCTIFWNFFLSYSSRFSSLLSKID